MAGSHTQLDKIKPEPEGTPDAKATAEVNDLFGNSKKKAAHYIYLSGLWFIFVLVVIGTVVLFWHYFAPERCRWLKQDEVNYITSIVVSAAFSALLALALERVARRLRSGQ